MKWFPGSKGGCSHVAGHVDLGWGQHLPFPLLCGEARVYTGSRYPTSLIVERVLSSKTHFIEARFWLARTISEAYVNILDIFF